MNDYSPLIIGWREVVDLPDWDIQSLIAKADTGARSTALDVYEITELPGDRVRFEVVIGGHGMERKIVEEEITRRTRVRSSFGQAHDRLFITTSLSVAGRSLRTEVGLVHRPKMLCRMLLGRRTLEAANLLVDSGKRYLHGRKRRKKSAGKEPAKGTP